MSTSFLPSQIEGRALDDGVRNAFADSLNWCWQNLPKKEVFEDFPPESLTGQLAKVSPAQFGFYYSLSTALSLWDGEQIDEQLDSLHSAWHGIIGNFSLPLQTAVQAEQFDGSMIRVTQLAKPYYSDEEIACIKQWLDMEPDNSIDLAPLEAEEFASAKDDLCRALNLIQKGLPDFYQEMQATTREIILAKPSGQQKVTFGGVSSFALWGALCLNIETHRDWRAYIPSLIHEYSHNILFAKAMHGPLVNNDPEARYFSPLRETMRPMDGIYHAAFVSAREVCAAQGLLQQSFMTIDPELASYLEMVVQNSGVAFRDCVACIEAHGELTQLGREILEQTIKSINQFH